ncbi:MAG: peroxiredoxin-like family protein [Hyphomicrobium sp.]|jgi:peroxiredoxin
MNTPSLDEILDECTERCRSMDAPLAVRLATFAAEVRRVSPEFADAVERMIERLRLNEAGSGAPRPGDVMPDFLLPDETGRLVSLSDLIANGPAVVAFHRGHWCPYCLISATALAEIHPDVVRHGATLIAITPEVEKFNAELKNTSKAPFPVLSDMDNGYSLLLNLAFYVGDEKKRCMAEAGWGITKFNDSESWMLPIPATFIVGQDGLVKARYVDPDYRRRMDVEDIIAALRELADS